MLKSIWNTICMRLGFVDRDDYVAQLQASKEKEDARGEELQKVLGAKKELEESKKKNAKLQQEIKKVGRRY